MTPKSARLPVPATPLCNITERLHGVEVTDPYRWLEDDNSPAVREWTARQTEYLRDGLDDYPGRPWIRERLQQLSQSEFLTPPVVVPRGPRRGRRQFYTRRIVRQDFPILYVREGNDGPGRELINPNVLVNGRSFSLAWWSPSPDGSLIAYRLCEGGVDESTLGVMEVDSGRQLPDTFHPTITCSLAWLSSGLGFYYTRNPLPGTVPSGEQSYHRHVFFHRLGTDPRDDPKVFGTGVGWSQWPRVWLSPDDRFLVIQVLDGHVRSDLYLLDLRDPRFPQTVPVAEDRAAIFHVIEVTESRAYVITNDGAPRWRLMAFELHAPTRWEIVVPERDDLLESAVITRDRIVAAYKKDAASRLCVCSLDGKTVRNVPLPCPGSVTYLSGHPEVDDVYFAFASFLTPQTVYRLDPSAARCSPCSEGEAPIDPSAFTVRQVRCTSRDGTSIPVFLVHRNGLVFDGTNPTLLYGYGGFNLGISPWFCPMALPLLERGGVFAAAVLRGGGEFGEDWHLAGVLNKKQNVFDDFIAAAEHLIETRITSRHRLAVSGSSNGGLLTAAVLTQRPDLFRAVVSGVPLTDMLRYHLFGIARLWTTEYGCADNPEHFPWLHAYSPYHHVGEKVAYPAALFFTSETDTRVPPLHARKMVARLQAATTGEHPIYLRVECDGGHGEGKSASRLVEQHLDELTFLFGQLAID